jgi:hypothetical protein
MFVGHYGPSFAIKAIRPAIPLWLLFIAVQLVDVAWAVLVLLGIEKVRIVPGITASNPFDLYYMPYTHSLVAGVLWALAAIVLCRPLRGVRNWSAAAFIGAAVFSHWVLDWLVHRPDLPLYDDAMKVGLGIWNYPAIALSLEAFLLFGGMIMYLNSDARDPGLCLLRPSTNLPRRRGNNCARLLCCLCCGCSVARPTTSSCDRLTRCFSWISAQRRFAPPRAAPERRL